MNASFRVKPQETRRIKLIASLAVGISVACVPIAANATSPTVVSYANGGMERSSISVTDSLGNLYVAGSIDGFFGLLKYSPQGALNWSYRNAGKGSSYSVYVDALGDLYCAGYTLNATGQSDWKTVKLGPQGNELWSHTLGSGRGQSVVSDGAGGVYVGGAIRPAIGMPGLAPITITRFTGSGALTWQRTLATGFNDSLDGLASDSAGNAIVVGRAVNPTRNSIDLVTTKLNQQGATLWQVSYGQSNRLQFPRDLVVNAEGGIWVTGSVASSENDALVAPFTLLYDANGTLVRSLSQGGADLALDRQGGVLVTDTLEAATLIDRRPSIAKFDGQGNKVWESILAVETGASPLGSRLALDDAANVFVASTIDTNSDDLYNIIVSKLNANGGVLWQHRFNGATRMTDSVTSLQADVFGNVFATGNSYIACSTSTSGSCESINTLIFPRGVVPAATSSLPNLPPAPPPAPSNLSTSLSRSTVTLQWSDNANSESGYLIERCSGNGCSNFAQIAAVGVNSTRYVNTGLSLNSTYVYRVRAFNAGGSSSYSNAASVKTPKK